MLSLKKIGNYNIFLMLIAVAALVLSIIALTRKGESFGDRLCDGTSGSIKKGSEGCIEIDGYNKVSMCTDSRNKNFACVKDSTCQQGKCVDTSNEYNCIQADACNNDSKIVNPTRNSQSEFEKEMQDANNQDIQNIMGNN